MKRLVGYLLVTLLTLSVSAPLAHSAVKPGSTCKKLNSTSEVGGYRYTCVKFGTKLVWNKGEKLNSTSKTVEPAKEIDYSSCMEERAYSMWKLASFEYSNVAKDFGQAYSARIDKGITNPKFGFDDLTFINKTPCKVKIQVFAEMQCYGPLGSQAYSYSMQSQTGDIQVSASSTITISVEKFFSSSKYSCESKPSQFVSLGMRNNLSGAPYLNFGASVGKITIKVEGADSAKPYKELPTPTPTSTKTLHPNKTKPVINVVLIPEPKSYAVTYDFQQGDEHYDLIIFESLTGEFKGEQYIVYVGNSKSVKINTGDFKPRWIVIRTRDEWSDQNISEVRVGPVTPKSNDPDTSTAPPPPTNVQVFCRLNDLSPWILCSKP